MRISLLKNGKIYNTDLPLKINGSFWVQDKDKNNQKRNLINIEARNGKWHLKSNFEVKIINNGQYIDYVEIEEYASYELQVKGENYRYIIYSLPIYDSNVLELNVLEGVPIVIGNDSNTCSINYNNKYMSNQQAQLLYQNQKLTIKTLNNNGLLFVNNQAIIEKELNVGDVIFLMGLKIIACGSYVIINNPRNLVTYNKQYLKQREPLKIEKDNNAFIEDTEIKVYDKNDYFFRMPRFRNSVEEEKISIDPPPEQEKNDEMPLAYTVGPMITMGMTSMVSGLTAISNVTSGQQTLKSALPSLITCGAMMLSMMVWPLLQKRFTARQRKKREKLRIKKYNQYIEEKRQYIKNIVSKKRQFLIENNISLDDCQQIILNRRRNLWERKIEHDDFLNIRLGIGNVEPYVKVEYPEEHFSLTENNLRNVLEKLGEETKIMEGVPVTLNFATKYISAIIGRENITDSFIKGLLLQIMTFHSYEDLKIVVLTNKENEEKWKFLKSSPYCWDDDRTIRFFSTEIDDANQISIYLENYFSNRKYEDGDVSKIRKEDFKNYSPYFLILTDDYQSLRNVEIVKDILSQKVNYGFGMILIQERLLGLPNECTTFISIDQDQSGIFENELTEDKQQTFKADFINNIDIERISNTIANIPIEMAKDRYLLPNKLGFLEMYDVGKIEQLNILNRWKNNNPITSLQAPVGVDTNGELFKLDLHEKVHGPHGLVAGMTGSGKSEFIITYILSMAVNYNPEEVSFVLIDYKGGGLAGAFENKETGIRLPHLAGSITNLDVNDMNRSLASIQSELKKRQKIFNEARQKLNESTIDIYKYQKLRREGKVDIAVPHLFIISDEFAELKTQQPEFMEQLISTARIGRSLGVHLILATQKPSGVVDDQIWSNSKFRVCLKVQDKSDSVDMIKCPDAASLHNVGRFYLQVGYNEFFALGQSAYAGVKYENTDKIKRKVDTNISFVNNVGYVIKNINNEEETISSTNNGEELTNIVNELCKLSKEENMVAEKLWLDKIPSIIYVDELQEKYNYVKEKCIINPVIGEYDDPYTQSQHLLTLPLSKEGNTIIYGASGMGKEDLLSTIMYSMIINHTPEEVNIYAIDFGAETLKAFEKIPHIGDILLPNEVEKINNLFKMLKEEIEKRKKLFSEFGGSYQSYIKLNNNILPNIVVIINLYEAFEEMYPDYFDEFNQLTREGFKYGIIFILTTSGVNFIRYKLKQNFKQNFVLQLNDEADYSDIVGNTHGLYPSKIKGRGLVKFDDIFEFQSATFKCENKTDYIKQLADNLNNSYKNKAKRIPVLPKMVDFDAIKEEIKGIECIPVGIEKNSLKTSTFDLKSKPVTIISSNDQTAFETFVPEFMRVCSSLANTLLMFIDAEKMFENEISNCRYYKENFDQVFNAIYSYSEKINKIYLDNNYNEKVLSNYQELLIVVNGVSQFQNKLSPELQDKFNDLFTMIKDLRKISFVIIDTIDNIKQFEYENWYKTVVSNNHGIWIGNGISEQYTIKLTKNSSSLREDIGNNYGYAIKKGNPILIKVLNNQEEDNDE